MSMTIREFLLARIALDESAAHRCAEAFPGSWEVEDRGHHAHVACDEPAFHYVSELDQHQTSADWLGGALWMIAEFQPARVLAECAAKRAIIEAHDPNDCRTDPYVSEPLLCILAAVYSDHPDYQDEWKL